MICYSLSTLDELDAIEAKEREEKERRNHEVPVPLGPYLNDVLDLDAILRLD